jgi:hypothetical protein
MATHLGYDVFAEPLPQNVTELGPNGDHYVLSPRSATLNLR